MSNKEELTILYQNVKSASNGNMDNIDILYIWYVSNKIKLIVINLIL